jgi:alpha-L-fucosidase
MPNYHAPLDNGDYQQVQSYIEYDPEPDYAHAPASTREAFLDMKYGIRIHWGLYSLLALEGAESWPFIKMSPEQRQAYQQLYQTFNPVGFNADAWMEWFQRVGLKCMAFTSKHHEGFSMFDTKTRVKQRVNWTAPGGPQIEACDLAYSVMEAPIRRDIVKELCEAAHRRGIMIDLYFSHPDWYDADFRPYSFHPLQTPGMQANPLDYGAPGYPQALQSASSFLVPSPERTPEETARMLHRHRQQLVELLTNYGKIDMLCLDMWLGKDVWPENRETVRLLRKLQPEVMLRIRGIGNYGDYYTPEGFVPGAPGNTDMPWMVIYPLGRFFSYEPVGSQYKGTAWIIHNLVDTVAKGGNFMVGIGPDGEGKFHPQAVQNLEAAGEWLKVNGEAIYATRPAQPWQEGEAIRFTRSKDGKCLYAFAMQWPGSCLRLESVRLPQGARVTMLGVPAPFAWRSVESGIAIDIPEALQAEKNRPCKVAWAFKIEG